MGWDDVEEFFLGSMRMLLDAACALVFIQPNRLMAFGGDRRRQATQWRISLKD
jgi:hypothetical protein